MHAYMLLRTCAHLLNGNWWKSDKNGFPDYQNGNRIRNKAYDYQSGKAGDQTRNGPLDYQTGN